MRSTLAIMLSLSMVLAAPVRGEETPAKPDVAKTETVPVQAAKADEKAFVPPDGWRPRKRGQFTVYCRKDFNVKGTRFPAETCYDEASLRAMVQQQLDDRASVDQMRRICAGDASCGAN